MPLAPVIAAYGTRFHGPGHEDGPDALAAAMGLVDALRAPVDCAQPVATAIATLATTLREVEPVPLVLCGECTLAPAVAGRVLARTPTAGLVWVDAHGDLNTPETSPSGFAGGMPFAALLGWCHPAWRDAAGGLPFPLGQAVLVGARDLDPGEREAIDRTGLRESATIVEGAVALGARPLWLHLDMDVLDPSLTRAADFPAAGGWSVERFADDLATTLAGSPIVAVSVCAGNPRRDTDGSGFAAIARALRPLLDR